MSASLALRPSWLSLAWGILLLIVLAERLPAGATRPGSSCERVFIRADTNVDGSVDLSDVISLLHSLFIATEALPCLDAADTNDDGDVNVSDTIFLIGYLYLGSEAPPHPGLECGLDPTPDTLDCARTEACPVQPPLELCDGLDNDCDGAIDEDFDVLTSVDHCGACGRSCENLGWANVAEYDCQFGICFIRACEEDWWDLDGIAENGCEAFLPPDGTPCDDGKPCTENDTFFRGICGGQPKDCSELDEPCRRGACDVETGECIAVPRPAGTPCGPSGSRERCDGRGNCVDPPIPVAD